jgi:hypothetical protein
MEAPLGFIPLREAADRVGHALYGSSWGSIEERLPLVAQRRVQRITDLVRRGVRLPIPNRDESNTEGWWWDVSSAEQVIAQGDADTEAAGWQVARDAALKAGLLLDAPTERDPRGEHVARMIAKACEDGRIASNLDRSVWRQGWYDFVAAGTINVDVPLADTLASWQRDMRELAAMNGWRPSLERCDSPGGWVAKFFRDNEFFTRLVDTRLWAGARRETREIFVREEDVERFIAMIPEPVTEQPEPVAKPTEQPQPKTGARRGRRAYDFGSIRSTLSTFYGRRGPPSPEDENPKWRSQADVVRWIQNKIGDAVGETTVKKFVRDFDAAWKKAHYKGGN